MPCALFLHGAGAWGGQWIVWQRVFDAAGWQTRAPDRMPVAEGLAATRLADHVHQVREALGEFSERPVVIGASLGGLLALLAADVTSSSARQPAALVLVNPLPPAPWAEQRPMRTLRENVVPWRSEGRFDSSRRALPSSGFADQRHAFRHWRDESTALLREAQAGIAAARPACPLLVIASEDDTEVPVTVSAAFAADCGASFLRVKGGHLDPVMGASAASTAVAALSWLNASPSSA